HRCLREGQAGPSTGSRRHDLPVARHPSGNSSRPGRLHTADHDRAADRGSFDLTMNDTDLETRRRFLELLGALTTGALVGGPACGDDRALPTDPSRPLQPAAADLGTLFADVDRLMNMPCEYSFLGSRFRDLDTFKKTGRDKLFELLLYRPERVGPRAE